MKAFLLSMAALVLIMVVADFALNDGGILNASSGAVWSTDNVRLD